MVSTEYSGKRVIVTGCSSGVGRATAAALVNLGAEVVGMSRRAPDLDLANFHPVDLSSPDSVATAVSAIHQPIDALFNCAGAPPTATSLDLVKVNFLGTRMLTLGVLELMGPGAAIANVSSSVAGDWRAHLSRLREFTATKTFAEGVLWYTQHEEHAGHGYPFSKAALTTWTMEQSALLISRGIRINAVSPGAVQTPLLEASAQIFPAEYLSATEHPIGRRSDVEEQVGPLLFLNSDAASYVNGADLATDGGHSASRSLAGSQW